MNQLSSSVRRRRERCLVGYNSPAMPDAITGKILIVDDDEGVTQTFARMLRLEGYQVRTAVSAEKGWQEVRRGIPTRSFSNCGCPSRAGSVFFAPRGRAARPAALPAPS